MKNKLISFIKSIAGKNHSKVDMAHHDIFGRVIEHAEDFFYPQKFRGIPVFDTDSIMRHYKTQINEIRKYTEIGDHRKTDTGLNMFDELYTNVIRRYIEYIHMIPASEDHHHAHTGGLLIHSLETSIAALRYAKERKYSATGMIDTDKQQEPIMHYCVWLAALLHDSGKIMCDISINATEAIHPRTKKPIKITTPMTSWRPQKQSLIEWATENRISAYSVSFINGRIHNRHNIDSAQILTPLLNGTFALDYILKSPLHAETYSELCRVLSGYTKSKDYLSQAVRYGDSISTGRNVGIQYDKMLGTRFLSTATRIYRSMQMAKKEWDWNINSAQGWIVGEEVFLRWTSAIDSILTHAQESQMSLPPDPRNVLTIMENNGLSTPYDKENRIIKFVAGDFTQQDLTQIAIGRKNVAWHSLIKMRGREMVFGTDPMPDPVSGLIYLPETEVFIIVDESGKKSTFNSHNLIDKTSSTSNTEGDNDEEAVKNRTTSLPNQSKTATNDKQEINPTSQVKKQEKSKIRTKNLSKLPVNNNSQNPEYKGLTFKNAPESKVNSTPKRNSQITADNEDKPVQAKQKRKPRSSLLLKSFIKNEVKYHKENDQCFIDYEDMCKKISAPFKDICAELETTGELSIDVNNPFTKTKILIINNEKIKTLPLVPRLSVLFTYLNEENSEALSSNLNAESNTKSKVTPRAMVKTDAHTSNDKLDDKIPAQGITYSSEIIFQNAPIESLAHFLGHLKIFEQLPLSATSDGIVFDPIKLTVLLRSDAHAKKVLQFTALNNHLKKNSTEADLKGHQWISNDDLLNINLKDVSR